MTKLARQQAILEIARQGPIGSQEGLQRLLAKRGLDVGQATLSRDLRELALVKTVQGYTLPGGNGHQVEAGLPPVERLVREFVQSIRPAQNLIVTVHGRLDRQTGLATWEFASIDPATGQLTDLPDAGFLPPNVNPDVSETQNRRRRRDWLCRLRVNLPA